MAPVRPGYITFNALPAIKLRLNRIYAYTLSAEAMISRLTFYDRLAEAAPTFLRRVYMYSCVMYYVFYTK